MALLIIILLMALIIIQLKLNPEVLLVDNTNHGSNIEDDDQRNESQIVQSKLSSNTLPGAGRPISVILKDYPTPKAPMVMNRNITRLLENDKKRILNARSK
ncbi:hypothetical protein RDWZM_001653 [Blomia tropicalis]|uniref:Uncharacterized protein n=1 Tax=Blomia tropicalis TaxID=40697 RepID=A0A9Q0MDG5_BLOTA|nr:hypothetical protein BLOT_008263 [Blomia tropicalis]KAJ6223108.1 hypothetical protein RDWZM_001653 [Blomia tropicalis]